MLTGTLETGRREGRGAIYHFRGSEGEDLVESFLGYEVWAFR